MKKTLVFLISFIVVLFLLNACQKASGDYRFPAIKNIIPENGSVNIPLDEPLIFKFSESSRAHLGVFLYLSETDSFLHAEPIEVNTSQYLPPKGWSPSTTYYWKLRLTDGKNTMISDTYHFRTESSDDYSINLLSPEDEKRDFKLQSPMKWEFTASDQIPEHTFFVYISNKREKIHGITPLKQSENTFVPETGWTPSRNYFWMIKAVSANSSDTVYATSSIQSFSTEAKKPGYPSLMLTSPEDEAADVKLMQPLQWKGTPYDSASTLSYKVYIAHSPEQLEKISPLNTAREQYLPKGGWKPEKEYYWKVQVCENGKCTVSDSRSFSTEQKDPNTPSIKLQQPVNNAEEVPVDSPVAYSATPSAFNNVSLSFKIYLSDQLEKLDSVNPIITDKRHYLPEHTWEYGKRYYWKVFAVQGDYSSYDGPDTFKIEDYHPDKPEISLVSPGFSAVDVKMDTKMTWHATPSSSSEQLSYEVYTASSREELEKAQPVETHKKEYLPSTGWEKSRKYFWKVRAVEGEVYRDSAVWYFSTEKRKETDPEIKLQSPEDGERNVERYKYLQWEGIPGISGETLTYKLYIAYTEEGLDDVLPIETDSEQYRPETLWEYNKEYFWKCVVLEENDKDVSGTRHFITEKKPSDIPEVELLSPDSGATGVNRETVLNWKGIPAVEGEELDYLLYIAPTLHGLDSATPVELNTENYLPSGGWEFSSTHYWRCKILESGKSNISETRYFKVRDKKELDPSITLKNPKNGELAVGTKVPLEWRGEPGIGGDEIGYEVYIAKSEDALKTVQPIETVNEIFLPPGGWEHSTEYFWKCKVIEEDRTNISEIRHFTTVDRAPDEPEIRLKTPGNETFDVDLVTELQWEATPGTAGDSISYKLYIADSLSDLNNVEPILTNNTSYQPKNGWEPDQKYFWRCQAIEDGKDSVSQTWWFETKSGEKTKPEISLSSPADNALNVALDSFLTWNATKTKSGPALVYDVFLGHSPEEFIKEIRVAEEEYRPEDNWQEETRYYWKVRAIQGDEYRESDTWNFKTGSGDEFRLAICAPASGAVDVDIAEQLTWNATENVETSRDPIYSVYIADSIDQLSFVRPYETTETTFSLDKNRWEYDEEYFWKLKGYDGGTVAYAGPARFHTRKKEWENPRVELTQPSENKTDVEPEITLRWQGTAAHYRNVLEYNVYYSQDEGALYSDPPATTLSGEKAYKPVTPLELNTRYYWRVMIKDGDRSSDATSTFSTRGPVYEHPEIELQSPENGEKNVELDANLTWTATESNKRGSRSSSLSYTVLIAENLASLTNDDALYTLEITDPDNTAYTPPTDWDPETSYVWTVHALYKVDDSVVASSTGGPYTFSTRGLLPATPSSVELIPGDGDTDVSIYTQLDWSINISSGYTTPTYYRVYMTEMAETDQGTTAYSSFNPEKLSTGTSYQWRIDAVNNYGVTKGSTWTFTTRNDTKSKTTDVFVKGDYLYAAEQENGLSVYKIPTDTNQLLTEKANRSLESIANGVTGSGDYLFASIGNAGITIFDISDPENPQRITRITEGSYSIDSKRLDDELYVADGFKGFIMDLSDINNPAYEDRMVPTNDASGSVIDLVVEEDNTKKYAYLADGSSGITIVDTTNPSEPALVSSGSVALDTDVESVGIDLSGDYIFLVNLTRSEDEAVTDDSGQGLKIIDISDRKNPEEQSHYNTTGFSKDVFVSGVTAYIADGKNGLVIVDISDKSSPVEKYAGNGSGTENINITANGLYVDGDTVYVAADDDGIKCFDISDQSNPKLIHE